LQLHQLQPLDLSTRSRPPMPNHAGGECRFALSPSLLEDLYNLSRKHKVTLFMTLLAGFKVLLHRYTGQEDISVGTPIANRRGRELEDPIGLFINTLVLHSDLSGDPTVEELLRRIRGVALEAYSNQDVPFEKLVRELQPERDMSRTPLFQVMFVLQNTPAFQWEL